MQATFVETVAKLVNGGEITGVSDVRDESDRDGMRVVVELRRGANAEVVVNNLYKQTSLQTTFPCNMVALVDKTPQTLNLKQFLEHFLDFRSALPLHCRLKLHLACQRLPLCAHWLLCIPVVTLQPTGCYAYQSSHSTAARATCTCTPGPMLWICIKIHMLYSILYIIYNYMARPGRLYLQSRGASHQSQSASADAACGLAR